MLSSLNSYIQDNLKNIYSLKESTVDDHLNMTYKNDENLFSISHYYIDQGLIIDGVILHPASEVNENEIDDGWVEICSNCSDISEHSLTSLNNCENDGYLLIFELIKSMNKIFLENCTFFSLEGYVMQNIRLLVTVTDTHTNTHTDAHTDIDAATKNHLSNISIENKLLEDDSVLEVTLIYSKDNYTFLISYIHVNSKYVVHVMNCESSYHTVKELTYHYSKIINEGYFYADGTINNDFTYLFKEVDQYEKSFSLDTFFKKIETEISTRLDLIYNDYEDSKISNLKENVIILTMELIPETINNFKDSTRIKGILLSEISFSDKLYYIINNVEKIINILKTRALTKLFLEYNFIDLKRISEKVDNHIILLIQSSLTTYVRNFVYDNIVTRDILFDLDDIDDIDDIDDLSDACKYTDEYQKNFLFCTYRKTIGY